MLGAAFPKFAPLCGGQLVAYRLAPGQPKLYGYVVCEGEGGAPLEVAGDLVEVEHGRSGRRRTLPRRLVTALHGRALLRAQAELPPARSLHLVLAAPAPSDAHHTGRRGVGQKADDYGAVPLCRACHRAVTDRHELPGRDRPQTELLFAQTARDLLIGWCRAQGPFEGGAVAARGVEEGNFRPASTGTRK